MNIKTYQEAAQRTMKPLGSLMLDMTHMTLGMSTELSELLEVLEAGKKFDNVDLVHAGEEIGDAMWYIVNYATLRDINLDDEVFMTPIEELSLVIIGGRLADFTKRWLAYDQPLENQKYISKEEEWVKEYISSLDNLASRLGLNIEDIMSKNILKLYTRYPDKFSTDAALIRDLEAERAVLEGKK